MGGHAQRQRILAAMIDSCAEKTYAATTITDIVARASISRTTFYKHFPDKRACFDATLLACIEEVRTVAREAHTEADPPTRALPQATAAILELLASRPALAQLLATDAIAVEPASVERYRRLLLPAVIGLWSAAGIAEAPRMDPNLAFGRALLLLFNRVVAGEADRVVELLPEIVYLASAPFAGHREALRMVAEVEPARGDRGAV